MFTVTLTPATALPAIATTAADSVWPVNAKMAIVTTDNRLVTAVIQPK
jgi:hypothetical protein